MNILIIRLVKETQGEKGNICSLLAGIYITFI